MHNAQPKQFQLANDGHVLFQSDPTNPLPGEPVARIRKGDSALAPAIEVLEGQDKAAVKETVGQWMRVQIQQVLEPLVALDGVDALPGPVRGICFQLYEAMGIVPRENLEDLIGSLDTDMRQILRNKQVRLGPVLVFVPALNKPAAVRLRAILWALWNNKPLPPAIPAAGVVSFSVDSAKIDRSFYQAVGYPVYGPRAVRIDMLDRVINVVYENAKDGKFQAEHKMAEWLGCSIEDLYAVLEAMGHRKIEDLSVSVLQEKNEQASEALTEGEKGIQPATKPVLATFRLKKGKAFEKAAVQTSKPFKPGTKKVKNRKTNDEHVSHSTVPLVKAADSPFAVLEKLKVKKDAASS